MMTEKNRRDGTAEERQNQSVRKDYEGEDLAEPQEPAHGPNTAKDVNVVRGDDRPQSVRHSG